MEVATLLQSYEYQATAMDLELAATLLFKACNIKPSNPTQVWSDEAGKVASAHIRKLTMKIVEGLKSKKATPLTPVSPEEILYTNREGKEMLKLERAKATFVYCEYRSLLRDQERHWKAYCEKQ